MAAIDEMQLTNLANTTDTTAIKQLIGVIFWQWYVINQNKKIAVVSWWFIKKTLYVRDVYDVFVMLFGPKPSSLL